MVSLTIFIIITICFLLYTHACYAQKEKYAMKNKSKKNQNALNMIASVFIGDVGVIGCTLKMIVPIKQL